MLPAAGLRHLRVQEWPGKVQIRKRGEAGEDSLLVVLIRSLAFDDASSNFTTALHDNRRRATAKEA